MRAALPKRDKSEMSTAGGRVTGRPLRRLPLTSTSVFKFLVFENMLTCEIHRILSRLMFPFFFHVS